MSASTTLQPHRQISGGGFRAALFGLSDGLVTNVSLILGFAGANPGHNIVRLAGLAGLVAGAFSMGTGEYLSVRAQKELFNYEIEVERTSLAEEPHKEREELRDIFLKQGIEPELAERLSIDLMRDPEMALRTHAREELGIDPSAIASPWVASSSSFGFFAIGAFLPLIPWLVTSSGDPLWWSIGVAAFASAAVGGAVGRYTHRGITHSALRQLFITGCAAAVTFGVGRLVGVH